MAERPHNPIYANRLPFDPAGLFEALQGTSLSPRVMTCSPSTELDWMNDSASSSVEVLFVVDAPMVVVGVIAAATAMALSMVPLKRDQFLEELSG
jgi:hypothetical protein